jgi:hypothetical protein
VISGCAVRADAETIDTTIATDVRRQESHLAPLRHHLDINIQVYERRSLATKIE